MRVSKQFHEVAGPLLYKKVVIKNRLAETMVGHRDAYRAPTKSRAASVNLKWHLLSLVEHLTIVTHTCGAAEPYFPNVKTLLVIPYADDIANEDLCQYSKRCSLLGGGGMRLQKMVIHNSRAYSLLYMVACPILTLSLNEGDGVRHLSRQVDLRGVLWRYVSQVRIIVSKLPAWLEFTAQMESGSERIVDIQALATSVLEPVMASIPVPVTVYLFRDLQGQDENKIKELKHMLDKGLARADQQALQTAIHEGQPAPQPRKAYTIKTLSDYIAEGLEDEFIWQELKYWREENDRRLKRDGTGAGLGDELV
jgi:hypothetical protein